MALWGKILDNMIVEVLDEGVSAHGLIHPDHIEKDNHVPGHWEQLPDGVTTGWHFKNGNWISGAQYWTEFYIEHPIPDPGPPTSHIIKNVNHVTEEGKTYVHVEANVGGWGFDPDKEYHEWLIDGKTYTEEKLDIVYEHKDQPYTADIQLTSYGPGGSHTHHVDEEEIITIPAKFVPLFYQLFNAQQQAAVAAAATPTPAVGVTPSPATPTPAVGVTPSPATPTGGTA